METCCICNKSIGDGQPTVKLRAKGSDGMNRVSEERGSNIRTHPGQRVHQHCRRDFCKPSRIAREKGSQSTEVDDCSSRRSLQAPFDFREHCIFCGHPAKYDGKKRGYDVIPVRTKDFQDSIANICKNRNDAWSQIVSGRLAFVNDLHAADAVYHNQCSVNFRTEKQIPQAYTDDNGSTAKVGRPKQEVRMTAFLKVATFLEENDEEQTTVGELVAKMEEYLQDTAHEAYSIVYMKKRIQEHFGEKIIVTTLNGKRDVVTFRHTASSILYEFHKKVNNETPEQEKRRIIETAAKLIQSDVKFKDVTSDVYPIPEEMSSTTAALEFIPDSLKVLLRTMFVGKHVDVKLASIGQAIMQAIRPRVLLAPLQLGLGIQLHHHFASRFLIDTLHSHDFSCSYSEVKKYERSAAVSQGTEIQGYTPDQHIQYVADNVDHNIVTLDGSGTFHGMGIIATRTPGARNSMHVHKVSVTAEDIAAVGRINIKFFKASHNVQPLVYKSIVNLGTHDPTLNLDMLWKTSLLLRSPRPSWSGLMQMVNHGHYPGQSSIMLLPMIDMNPSDLSCVYSTLLFVCDHAAKYNATPILTFDQPLWWKALTIIRSQPNDSDLKRIVLRLGGLHTEMSFLGSIGHLMTGSGLQELLEIIYARNTVGHMLSGKAISRAVRGHLLVDAALNTVLVANLFNVELPLNGKESSPEEQPTNDELPTNDKEPNNEDPHAELTTNDEEPNNEEPHEELTTTDEEPNNEVITNDQLGMIGTDLGGAQAIYDRLMSGAASVDEICSSDVIHRILNQIKAMKQAMTTRTARLWLQYLDMIDILRVFIKAERMGNWELHLQAIHDMLPYFAASGHILYAKSAYIYLQMMHDLPKTHPDIYRRFQDGYHVVRRSDRYWAGLSTDLIIEQVLMRSIKTSGGLTRGTGMTETQRNVWLLSMPSCADVNCAMQDLTGIKYETSDQHKDVTRARQNRDVIDTLELLSYLKERNPFSAEPSLHSIANGMTAERTVNVDQSRDIGSKILDSMVGKNVENYTFKRADQAVTLGSRTCVKIRNESVQVDPQLLFQRLVAVSRDRVDDISSVFSYELCSYPPALFESPSLPLEATKSVLADAIWKVSKHEHAEPGENVHYILDGGALLHRIQWPRRKTYNNICQIYVDYVTDRYGHPTIVFDGYEDGPTTKDVTHIRRSGACPGVTVNFAGDMVVTSKKDEFLANEVNKQRFINLLSDKLQRARCTTVHARHDADVMIVTTAVESARTIDTILVGDDTDLLILLIHYAELNAHNIYFAPEPKQNSKKNRKWSIKRLKMTLGSVCDHILFIHSILGCDTTSRLFGIGKGVALKRIMGNASFREHAKVFNQMEEHLKEDIIRAGEKALVSLYNGEPTEGLDTLRYRKFCVKVSTNTSPVEAQTLPPTSAAAKYHSLRVYYQIMEWKGLANSFLPEDWGWQLVDRKYLPLHTDQPPAPQSLLEVIRCGCKKDCANKNCTCRKYGLPCSTACTECRGTCCTNSPPPDLDMDAAEDDFTT